MTCSRSYQCDLCYAGIDPNQEKGSRTYGIGIYHETGRIKLVSVRDAEHHLCGNCITYLLVALPA